MLKALQENVAKYEEKFGIIEEVESPEAKIGFNVGEK